MNNKTLRQVTEAVYNFNLENEPTGCIAYGNGHINDTFLVTAGGKDGAEIRYILQGINHNVFKEPEKLMHNIEKVTSYLSTITDNKREVLTLVPTNNGKTFFKDQCGNYWRMYNFVEDSICIELPETTGDFYQCGVAFGKFQSFLDKFPADSLYETIPDFHNTPKRYENFLKALNADKFNRAANVATEINFVNERKDFYPLLIESNKKGVLPLRVSHNDTKINNVMLDSVTRKALCVIDLDTIMPGFSVTDFGDSIRFGASTGAEDEIDLSKINLNLDMFEMYTKGFIEGCGGMLGNDEIMLLPEGAKMMTIECGMRFLTDYLEGDTYFKTAYPDHNLIRCRTQFKLVSDMELHWDKMKAIVSKYCK